MALLVQAVNQLPAGDRDGVFAWLLRVGWRHYSPPAAMLSPRRSEDPAAMLRIFQAAEPGSVQQPASQVVRCGFPLISTQSAVSGARSTDSRWPS